MIRLYVRQCHAGEIVGADASHNGLLLKVGSSVPANITMGFAVATARISSSASRSGSDMSMMIKIRSGMLNRCGQVRGLGAEDLRISRFPTAFLLARRARSPSVSSVSIRRTRSTMNAYYLFPPKACNPKVVSARMSKLLATEIFAVRQSRSYQLDQHAHWPPVGDNAARTGGSRPHHRPAGGPQEWRAAVADRTRRPAKVEQPTMSCSVEEKGICVLLAFQWIFAISAPSAKCPPLPGMPTGRR